jgi:hypothetical protein
MQTNSSRGPHKAGCPSLTRREFAAAATLGALAGATLGPSSAAADDQDESAEEPLTDEASLSDEEASADEQTAVDAVDDEGNTNVLLGFRDLSEEVSYQPIATYDLPLGSVVYADCDTRAAVIQRSDTLSPLTVIGCLDYASGEYTVVLPEPIGGRSFTPSEARATEQLLVWLEVNNTTDDWALYAVPFTGQEVGVSSPGLVQLGSGDADWLPPQFDVAANRVVWQVMPDPSGPYSSKSSHAYLWTLGQTSGTSVWESPGRFACEPNISAGVLTLTPRVTPDQGVYYAVIALDLDRNLELVDQVSMPVSVKPFRATRVGDVFAFSVEANYGYGGRLGNMGYYIGDGAGPYRYLSREPSAQVSAVGGRYVVRSLLSYFVVDPELETYTVLSAASSCVDYGDYPACAGTVGQFVTYAAVKDVATGIPSHVSVRVFSLA